MREAGSEREEAWEDLHAATPSGWHIGPPTYNPGRRLWEQYAFDPSERPKVGLRSREWTAIGDTEEDVVRELGRCLREIREGRVPC